MTSNCKVLSLDGGGAKGFYTIGVLRELEGLLGSPLCEHFDLIFGTSTGSIIASLLGLGRTVGEISELYEEHVPTIMKRRSRAKKSRALADLADEVFNDKCFNDMRTGVGIVATKWIVERPMIFKAEIGQAHGRRGTFTPGFGVLVSDAVQASCSAYPFFRCKTVTTDQGDRVELVDGGYCANNPTLYAIADATRALGEPGDRVRVLSVGVGTYPAPRQPLLGTARWLRMLPSVQLLQKTLEINTQSMDQLRQILFSQIQTVRISDTFEQPEMATDLFEHDKSKLNILRQRGSESFASRECDLKELFALQAGNN